MPLIQLIPNIKGNAVRLYLIQLLAETKVQCVSNNVTISLYLHQPFTERVSQNSILLLNQHPLKERLCRLMDVSLSNHKCNVLQYTLLNSAKKVVTDLEHEMCKSLLKRSIKYQ